MANDLWKENWKRSYKIHIGTADRDPEAGIFEATSVIAPEAFKKSGAVIDGEGITIPSNARKLSNLEVDGNDSRGFTFSIESTRGLTQSVNKGSEKTMVKLYGIDDDLEGVLNQKNCVIRVFLGYGEKVALAYAGDVVEVTPYTQGSDRIWKLKCVDGGDTATDVIGTIDYDESVSEADVIRDLAGRFPDAAVETGGLSDLEDSYVTGGFSFTGSLTNNFERMVRKNNLSTARYNGKIVLVPYRLIDGTTDFEYIAKKTYTLSADLIKGISSRSSNGQKTSSDTKDKAGVVVNTNFIPIEVGQFFTIPEEASIKYKGTYLVKAVKIDAESHGQMWDVAITGEIIS